ncbi:pyridoxamine 5'-phosphate oxidase family protein [Streptomyces sp. NPDC051567]|uniref:pyridoxamine 5'-phosphate oxidase family protein n=1 Tax=Streptomyces sp. NPDC051567 TaxID=3365660 RepID=UPI0037AA374B
MKPVYHRGSPAVQERVGVRGPAERVGRSVGAGIREVAAAFLALQPHLVVGAADPEGQLWASLLTGAPGFVRATAPDRMTVTGGLPAGDPLARALATAGTPVGTLALDPRTRRRMRLNGLVDPVPVPGGFAVAAREVFSNCPKYLQKRRPLGPVPEGAGVLRRGYALTPGQERAVRAADTFFVATTAPGEGADASHRGGMPGFVEVVSPVELFWPDYPGNAMFLTLGNLATDPRAGLLFPDWESGAVLQLSGRARTECGADGGRGVRFRVESVRESLHPGRLRWSAPEYSPANPVPPSPEPSRWW